MASVLVVTNGLPGMLYTSIELACRLRDDGHEVVYASVAGAAEAVARRGLPFRPLAESGYTDFVAKDRDRGYMRRWWRLTARRREAVASLRIDDFDELLRRTAPDLVLIDGEMHEQIIVARTAGRRVALLNTFVSIWRRAGLPPPHCFVVPGEGIPGSAAGMTVLWWGANLRKTSGRWRQWLRRAGCDRVSVLRRLAAARDFDFRGETDFGQWLKPFTYRRLPVLSLHAAEFELPHVPPARVRYVGPMVPTARDEGRLGDDEARRLRRVLADTRQESGRKLVYLGFGSFSTVTRDLMRRLVTALGRHPEWQVVVSHRRHDAFDIEDWPGNFARFRWVPQLEVLEAADVMIGHGGINSVDESLSRGVPMLIYRGPETDMAGTAARVAYHGVGIVGDERRDGVAQIEGHVARLLDDPDCAERVARLRSVFASYRDDRVAERAVGALLGPPGGEAASA